MNKLGFRKQFGPVFACVGIVGTAVTVFGSLQAVLDMADWARWIVVHWADWSRAFWGWTLGWIGLRVPDPFVPFLTATAFYSMLVIDSASREPPPENPPHIVVLSGLGAALCMGILLVPAIWSLMLPEISDRELLDMNHLMDRIDGGLLLFLVATIAMLTVIFTAYGALRVSGLEIKYFTWRPAIIGLMVLLLLGLNELSKLDLVPLLKAPKAEAQEPGKIAKAKTTSVAIPAARQYTEP